MTTKTKIQKILFKIFTIFTIGIILRYFINEYIHIPSILEYLDYISIFISYIINYLFIEPYIDYDIYGYDLDKSEIKRYNLDNYITNLASQLNPNNKRLLERDLSGTRPINDTSQASSSSQNSKPSHYYDELEPLYKRTPWVGNHSNGFSHYYLESKNRISIPIDCNVDKYKFDAETKSKLVDAVFHDVFNPPTYMEFPIETKCLNGLISIGIKHYGNPSDPVAFYIKHFDLVKKEHVWDIWRKDINVHGSKFKDLWKEDINKSRYKGTEPFTPVNPINSKMKIWKRIDTITELDTSRAINDYMYDIENPFRKIHKSRTNK